MSVKRGARSFIAAAICAGLVLSGCSSNDSTDEAATTSEVAEDVTIEHARGTDTYPVNPQNVVAVGPAVDNLLELGIKPAAVVQNAKDKNSPWREGKLDGVKVIDQTDFKTLPQERIAAIEPDFIVGDYWTISEANYKELSAIAPTLGGISDKGEGIGWESQLEALGKIFNKESEAKKAIEEDQKRFSDVKEKLPNLSGKTGIVSQFAQGSFGAVADPEDPGASFIYDLGMKFPDKLTDGSVPVDKGRVTLSPENVSYLAADFMVIYNRTGSIEEVENIPGYKDLPQVKSDATLAGDEAVVAGLNNPTSLSRAWVLDKTMPTLEKVGK
ncbi:ABC transporter substrate-binding protein [Corynebacterium sp. MSK204]|uniref:ABC transporter substrate-binding protein n=1 Tax=Corynebacterium sp. MSK204 TaxID=3050217 RepID=UPI00254B2388|nr:ABC transporter substrate-binding protein [Corynebacterium sp. MSK204]MDK8660158.1 ABC transporter substrate-binding protein [Corynebacterium sp. MSK204]